MTFKEFIGFLTYDYPKGREVLEQLSIAHEAGEVNTDYFSNGKDLLPISWIDYMMVWRNTPQGHEYWEDIYEDLGENYG